MQSSWNILEHWNRSWFFFAPLTVPKGSENGEAASRPLSSRLGAYDAAWEFHGLDQARDLSQCRFARPLTFQVTRDISPTPARPDPNDHQHLIGFRSVQYLAP
jgi:hypothetical protein